MQNALLNSGKISDYVPIGQDGQPVYRNAEAFLAALNIHKMVGPELTRHLARPKIAADNNTIDWYIPFAPKNEDGQYRIVTWQAATPQEQEQARSQLRHLEQVLKRVGVALGNHQAQGTSQLFAHYLTGQNSVQQLPAIHFPSNDCVFIVDGVPVITFWGFTKNGAPMEQSPFASLKGAGTVPPYGAAAAGTVGAGFASGSAQAAVPPQQEPQQEDRSRNKGCLLAWPMWLLWLLLLLLLLLLLWWLWPWLWGLLASLFGFKVAVPSANLNGPDVVQEMPLTAPPLETAEPVLPGANNDAIYLDPKDPTVTLNGAESSTSSSNSSNSDHSSYSHSSDHSSSSSDHSSAVSNTDHSSSTLIIDRTGGELPAVSGEIPLNEPGAVPDAAGEMPAVAGSGELPLTGFSGEVPPADPMMPQPGELVPPETMQALEEAAQAAQAFDPNMPQDPGAQVPPEPNMPQGSQTPSDPTMPQTPSDPTMPQPQPDPLANPGLTPEQEAAIEAARAAEAAAANNSGVVPPQPAVPENSLNFNEQALAQQGPSVLNGAWNTRSGLMDRATGTPLQLGYSFSGDQGQVTVTRPDGVKCVAQTAATVAGSGVNITTQGNAVCPDGKSYRMPEVKCEPQGDGTVRCTGHYGSYSFPIQFYNAQ
ncbi:MAG: hypothetical protein ROM54_12000 [Anaerobiospirillum sp.]|nr:hypothetical protein [Anaerobiospirillum sp.]